MKRKVLIKEFKHVIRTTFPPSSYLFGYQNVSSFISRDKTNVRPNESEKVYQYTKLCELKNLSDLITHIFSF